MVLGVVLAGVVMTLGWLGHGFLWPKKTWTWHQQLTLVVQTPAGTVSGGSVVRVHAKLMNSMQGGEMLPVDVTGEASVVEVAPGRYLFALLVDQGGSDTLIPTITARTFPEMPDGEVESRLDLHEERRETRPVPLDDPSYARDVTPMLVTFRDPRDPKTAELVDPRDLAATFGEGFALEAMTLSLVDGPVSEPIVPTFLPWVTDEFYRSHAIFGHRGSSYDYPKDIRVWMLRSTN